MASTVLTWNVRWATPRSPRRHEILHRIFRHNPDIVCLTEVDSQLLADRSGHVIRSRPDGIVAKVREALQAAFSGDMEIATADLDVIDHIALTRELRVRNRAVIDRFHDDRELSDHCGVVADVAVDHVDDRFTEVPFDGLQVDGDGNVVDPPPGPARDRAVGLIEG